MLDRLDKIAVLIQVRIRQRARIGAGRLLVSLGQAVLAEQKLILLPWAFFS